MFGCVNSREGDYKHLVGRLGPDGLYHPASEEASGQGVGGLFQDAPEDEGGEGVGLLGANGVGRGRGGGGEGVGRRVSCQFCGRELTVRNMTRHLRQSCRVWDPGGGARPRPAVSGQRRRRRRRPLARRPLRVQWYEAWRVALRGRGSGGR